MMPSNTISDRKRDCPGFTLIEVLVVVAIIAILAAVLLPSLQRARESAKIASCKANSKQIASITATYESEFRGYLPVLFNYGIPERGFHPNEPLEHYAKHAFISVALRMYDKGLKNLEKTIAPDGTPYLVEPDPNNSATKAYALWNPEKRKHFERNIMPKYYACPFGRDRADAQFRADMGTVVINGAGGQRASYDLKLTNGVINAYGTWGWQGRVVKGELPMSTNGAKHPYPGDPGGIVTKPTDGRPKYSIVSWNFMKLSGGYYLPEYEPPTFLRGNGKASRIAKIYNKHRRWDTKDAQSVKSASLSEVTTTYCMLGKFISYEYKLHNPDSHRTNLGGGSVASFADSHVEWIKGTQIGWD